MHFSEYQKEAATTSQLDLSTPEALTNALFGLAHETGSILNIEKKHRLSAIDRDLNPDFLRHEMGDLLWFLAAIATACRLDLDEIATSNLARVKDLHWSKIAQESLGSLPSIDEHCDPIERFPRRMALKFGQHPRYDQTLVASAELVFAYPNTFPAGPIRRKGEKPDGTPKDVLHGFSVPMDVGNKVTDNSRRPDGYRFHDAIHLGFVAVLGWSPSIRYLLNLKRRSSPATDHAEDGARAIFAEEGLTSILARMSEDRNGFRDEKNIDEDVLSVVKHAIKGLEVDKLPTWAWRRAINQGFIAMWQLIENSGGFLSVDLDRREVRFTKEYDKSLETRDE